jgi:DNA-binding CsgD family transcriptional regulator
MNAAEPGSKAPARHRVVSVAAAAETFLRQIRGTATSRSLPPPSEGPGDDEVPITPDAGQPSSAGASLSNLTHQPHPGCLITSAFRNQVDAAEVAVVVVNEEGFFVYANAQAELLLGYPVAELCQKHIFEVAAAESAWVGAEFGHLQQHDIWSGHVLLHRMAGDFVRTSVNAFSSRLPSDGAEFFALLHPTTPEGPALARLPDQTTYQLTPRDVSLLQLIADGFADKEIANVLGTSVWTINKDVSEMLGKLGASSRTAACVMAFREGIIV